MGNIHACIMTECPHEAGQEPGMQQREITVRHQDSGERRGKMSPLTRPAGRQLFPPGSGSGGSWIKLCWGVTQGDTGNEAREIFAAVIPDLYNGAAETDSHYFYCRSC